VEKTPALFLKWPLYTHHITKRYHSKYYRRFVERMFLLSVYALLSKMHSLVVTVTMNHS